MRYEYKGRTAEFSRIVAYGCSFTEGHEILDYEHKYKTLKTPEEIDNCKKKYKDAGKSIYQFYQDNISFESGFSDGVITGPMISRTRSRAWPAMLAKRFGSKYINRGFSGTGMWNHIQTYEQDTASGLIKDDDLIIFGLTTASRFFWLPPKLGPQIRGVMDTPYTLMPGMRFQNVLEFLSQKFLDLFDTEYANPLFTCSVAFQAIKYIEYLSHARKGLALMVPAAADLTTYGDGPVPKHPHMFWEMGYDASYALTQPFKKDFEKDLLSYVEVEGCQNAERLERTGGYHTYYHPKLEAYQEFVDEIYEAIKC